MSPLVSRSRPVSAQGRGNPGQHWGMLVLESLSAGIMALAFGMGLVLALVGIYCVVVWPLTFWDLGNLGLEEYASWTNTVLWSVFAGGSLAGFWVFSGYAFKSKPKSKVAVRPGRTRG